MADQHLYYTFEDKKYPIFTTVDGNGNLSQVKGIPLKCPTCPSVPRFKDVSHLVTHYGSRDHLKAANETRIRSDLRIPESVRVYALYQLWESHNLLWRWLVETHRRKNKLNEVNKEEDGFPEYQPTKAEPEQKKQTENSANGFPGTGDKVLPAPTRDTQPPLAAAKNPPKAREIASKAAPRASPKAVSKVALKTAPKTVLKRAPAPKEAPTPAQPKDTLATLQPAPSDTQTPTQGGPPPQGQKRPRGRPRKYPVGSKPVRPRKPGRPPASPKKAKVVEPETPAAPIYQDPILDIESEFPVDPLAPKAKPVRVRRTKRRGTGDLPEETHRPPPVLKGKTYPGMAVYDFANVPKPENGINVLITAADQQALPFDIDGHILHFDENGDDSVEAEVLEESDERPSKRFKNSKIDESFNLSASTEADESNESVNVSNDSTQSKEGADVSGSTESRNEIDISGSTESKEEADLSGSTESKGDADVSGSTESSGDSNKSMEISATTDKDQESLDSVEAPVIKADSNNDMVDAQPSFVIFEDESDEDKENKESSMTLEFMKRPPLREFGSSIFYGSRQFNSPQSRSKVGTQHHGNQTGKGANEVQGVDLYSPNPFLHLKSETPTTTFKPPVLPRHRVVRTYEGLSADGSSFGWQGSFFSSPQQ